DRRPALSRQRRHHLPTVRRRRRDHPARMTRPLPTRKLLAPTILSTRIDHELTTPAAIGLPPHKTPLPPPTPSPQRNHDPTPPAAIGLPHHNLKLRPPTLRQHQRRLQR